MSHHIILTSLFVDCICVMWCICIYSNFGNLQFVHVDVGMLDFVTVLLVALHSVSVMQ